MGLAPHTMHSRTSFSAHESKEKGDPYCSCQVPPIAFVASAQYPTVPSLVLLGNWQGAARAKQRDAPAAGGSTGTH